MHDLLQLNWNNSRLSIQTLIIQVNVNQSNVDKIERNLFLYDHWMRGEVCTTYA